MMSWNFLLNVEQYLCTAYIPQYRDNNKCFLKFFLVNILYVFTV